MTRTTLTSLTLTLGFMAGQGALAEADEGAELYRLHCAACHGAEATGNGPMAPILTLQPPDLTALAGRNDGVFPIARVVARIDGTDPLVAHGSPMPVYGPLFGRWRVAITDENGETKRISRPIRDLVDFLASIQK